MPEVRTFCRICEPSCGLIAHVDQGALVKLTPDREHPVTKGFACHKGLAAIDVHNDPDRLDHPMLRAADGTWTTTTWDDSMAFTARRLREITAQHGDSSIAAYIGNPDRLQRSGVVTHRPATAIARCATHVLVWNPGLCEQVRCIGGGVRLVERAPDPRPRAHRSLPHHRREPPRLAGELLLDPERARRAPSRHGRGARIIFVNPRRIETPERGVGETLLIRPDTDVWFLAALLHEIDRIGGFDERVIQLHGTNIDGLRAFIEPYTAESVAGVTGIDPATITDLAAAWVSTPAASVHASTGLNMGRQGTLAYWLVHMLSFVTGRLDASGGNLKSDGFYANARSGAGVPEQGYVDSEFGRLRRGALPGTLMSHAILDSDEPIRAMIVVAGNPLLSIGGQERLRKAFEQLELLVVIDIYPSATAELAHVVFPATDMYERDDLNIVNIGTSAQPFAQYTPAVVDPHAERRPEWWIAHRLLQEMGLPSILDDDEPDPWSKWRHMLERGSDISLAELQESGEVRVLPTPTPGTFFDEQVHTLDGRVDCCPGTFADAFVRCTQMFDAARAADPDELRLIHRRDPWMHNSWFANVARMKRGGRTTNPLSMHPDDAATRGLHDGESVRVTSAHGEVHCVVEHDVDLMPGVVSMVHGWGHGASPRLRVAHEHPGTNPNVLLPIGPGSFEPLSSQAHMTGIPVLVTALS